MKRWSYTIILGAVAFGLTRAMADTLPIPPTCKDATRGSGVVQQNAPTVIQGSFTLKARNRRGHLHGALTYTDVQTGVKVTAHKLTRYEADPFNPDICRYFEFQGKTSTRQRAKVGVFLCDEGSLGTADAFSIDVDPQPHSIDTEFTINGNLISGDITVTQTCR